MNPKDIAGHAVALFGPECQQLIAIEEMSELVVSMAHLRRGRGESRAVVEEIADVCLAMESLKHIFGYDKVQEIITEKTNRLNRHILVNRDKHG